MKKTIRLAFLFFSFLSFSQNPNLKPEAEISIITIGPGNSLNDAFGHNAFRVRSGYVDIVYDYGRYPFNDPNFILNFARGKLKYSQGKEPFYSFLRRYVRHDRTIKEQVLDLSYEQKRALYSFLIENNKPENKDYLYDFFYDNCATKMRDVAEQVLNSNIVYKTPESYKSETFRQLINNNLNWNSWGSLGINIALGSVIDKPATPREYMFLPEFIFQSFENASFKNTGKPLVKSSSIVYKQKEAFAASSFFTSPLFVFSLISIFIIYITYNNSKNSKRSVWLDISFFGLTGIIGVFILLLWFATDHTATAYNYNLLWAFPLSLFAIIQVVKKQPKKWFIGYLKLLIIMLGLMTMHWVIGVQRFAPALIPLLIAFLIRYIYLLRFYKFANVS
ncbi:lipoprotein N-acyltransferase Lnb domain-containing protein [Pontimicrobium sp. MEBiC06410]